MAFELNKCVWREGELPCENFPFDLVSVDNVKLYISEVKKQIQKRFDKDNEIISEECIKIIDSLSGFVIVLEGEQ